MPTPFAPDGWNIAMDLALLGRLVLAAVLGGLIGMEREVSGKPAGLRTNLLICVGAALLTELSIAVASAANLTNVAHEVGFRADPGRIAAQIVSGIGFLGAGTILQSRGHVVGLTTAATIWVVAAIGMAVGAQAYAVAIGATILVLTSLVLLSRLETFVEHRWGSHRYMVSMAPSTGVLDEVETMLRDAGLRMVTHEIDKAGEAFEVMFDLSGPSREHHRVIRELAARDDVRRVSRML